MDFTRTGLILYVTTYDACVDFYGQTIGLRVMFHTPELTCFEFGSTYLMIEPDDQDRPVGWLPGHGVCLRMNVPDVRAVADQLHQAGVAVDYQEHSWGTVAKFHDPEGNLLAFKDDEMFEAQVAG